MPDGKTTILDENMENKKHFFILFFIYLMKNNPPQRGGNYPRENTNVRND